MKMYSRNTILDLISKLQKKMIALEKNYWDGHTWNNEVFEKIKPEVDRVGFEYDYWHNVLKTMNHDLDGRGRTGFYWGIDEVYLTQRFGPIPFTKKYETNTTREGIHSKQETNSVA